MAPAVLGVCVRHVMSRRCGERAVIMKVQNAEICLAKTRSVCKHGVKYRGELARRTRYDTQHLRGSRLLLQRLRKVSAPRQAHGCALRVAFSTRSASWARC